MRIVKDKRQELLTLTIQMEQLYGEVYPHDDRGLKILLWGLNFWLKSELQPQGNEAALVAALETE